MDLKKLRELAEAATPGVWGSCEVGPWGGQGYAIFPKDAPHTEAFKVSKDAANGTANALFFAAANPATVLALLDEIERLREAVHKPLISLPCGCLKRLWGTDVE